ncbi:DUF2510 domain-containing protein [Streptomyces sp. NPDC051320]|uniref:DUF2510 domain-containing protein n=1 Tax=Streptomyces sp. NPDC051320 TaxID=3154644 RepID=UPI00341F8EDC
MTHATPPAWYPDASLPATERWWDGTAWTAATRPLTGAPQQFGAPVQQPEPPQFGPASQFGPSQQVGGSQQSGASRHFGEAPQPASPRAGSGVRAAVIAATGVVLVAAVVVGVVVAGRDDGGRKPTIATGSSSPATRADAKDTPTAPTASAPPTNDPALLVDQLDGITLPIPNGWEKPDNTVEDVTTMRTEHSYECPGDTASFCWHGTVTSRTATQTDLTTAEAVAKADIKDAANRSYDRDIVGNLPYDGITSHTEIKSASVPVAGRTGYLIRWRVKTGAGPGGYVQTLAVPSSVGSESIVVVRFAFDAGPDGPPLSTMDSITRGIRPIGDSTNGGVGSSVGP